MDYRQTHGSDSGNDIDCLLKMDAVILKLHDLGLCDVDLVSDCYWIRGVAKKDEKMLCLTSKHLGQARRESRLKWKDHSPWS